MKYKIKRSYWQRDIRKREYIAAVVQGVGILLCISHLFYGTYFCAILFSPYLIWYLKSWTKKTIKKKKEGFRLQFREAMQSISAALNVGYSMENALREAMKDLGRMYRKEERIQKELSYMVRQIQMNVTAEKALSEFAARTEDEDVELFATVFAMAKRSGGDTMEIIRSTVRQLSDKLEVEKEIQTMLAAKQLEFRLLTIIPLGMIGYLKLSFPGMVEILYGNVLGVVVMSVCLLVYLFSYEMGKRVVEIEV